MIQLVLKLTNIGGFGRLMIPSNMSISRGLTRSLNMIYSNYLYFFFSFCYVLTCPPFFNYLFQTSLSFFLSLSLSNFLAGSCYTSGFKFIVLLHQQDAPVLITISFHGWLLNYQHPSYLWILSIKGIGTDTEWIFVFVESGYLNWCGNPLYVLWLAIMNLKKTALACW